MIFYILFQGDTEADTVNDRNKLGHVSFKTFHPNEGWKILRELVNNDSDKLNTVRIIDSKGKQHNLEDFLDILNSYSFNSKLI